MTFEISNPILSYLAILPELILVGGVLFVIIADMFVKSTRSRSVTGGISIVSVALALISLLFDPGSVSSLCQTDNRILLFDKFLVFDSLSFGLRFVFLLGTLLVLVFSLRSFEFKGKRYGEFAALILGANLSASAIALSNNLLGFYLALETLSLCSYVLAAFNKDSKLSAEAGLKYTLYGSVSSALLLFGFSYLYGITGHLQIDLALPAILYGDHFHHVSLFNFLPLFFIICGLGFKIAMVPFHFWCPDVYEGAPTVVTAFLSVVSKGAGIAGFLRLFLPPMDREFLVGNANSLALILLFGFLAAITMTFGNLIALRQNNMKRLLAYSAIAHAGYLMMGFTIISTEAYQAMLFYLTAYLIMNLAAFYLVILFSERLGGSEIRNFMGAAKLSPALFVVFFIALISLTGLPPTVGFAAKFILFKAVIGEGLTSMDSNADFSALMLFYLALALIGLINSVISLFYYMKVCKEMVFAQESDLSSLTVPLFDKALAVIFGVTLVVLVNFGLLYDFLFSSY